MFADNADDADKKQKLEMGWKSKNPLTGLID